MPDSEYEINFKAIDFPTDKVTLGDLRRRPETTSRNFLTELADDLDTVQFVQEGFVRLGFAGVTAGNKGQDAVLNEIAAEGRRPEAESFLVNRYLHYGLADGPETAKQIIRRLEEAGAQQAREKLGRTDR